MVPELWSMTDKFFCHFGSLFALLPPPSPSPKNPKNQHFEEMKKTPAEIMILHKCTKNHDHMLHCP